MPKKNIRYKKYNNLNKIESQNNNHIIQEEAKEESTIPPRENQTKNDSSFEWAYASDA